MRAAGEGPRVLLLRMRCMKRAHVALYDGCSISGVSRRNVNERIIGSSACGRSGRAGCLLVINRRTIVSSLRLKVAGLWQHSVNHDNNGDHNIKNSYFPVLVSLQLDLRLWPPFHMVPYPLK